MPTFANKLDEMLTEALRASGLQRQTQIDVIRDYVRSISIDQLRREIAAITSISELSLLNAVGVPLGAQTQFYTQISRYGGG
jgi:hypothetical protein